MLEQDEHDFTAYMEDYLGLYIERTPCQSHSGKAEYTAKNVRFAVLDTRFYVTGKGDGYFLQGAQSKTKLKEDITDPDPRDCHDCLGHGTHVARLLLRFAPGADIYVAKASSSISLEEIKMDQLSRVWRRSSDRRYAGREMPISAAPLA